jgi:hypothetical protein
MANPVTGSNGFLSYIIRCDLRGRRRTVFGCGARQRDPIGDPVCCYSDLREIKGRYHGWSIPRALAHIIKDVTRPWQVPLAS